MAVSSRSAAQQRADDIRIFQAELGRLEREGALALTDDQRRTVAAHHERVLEQLAQAFDIDRDVQAKQLSLGMRIASFLGALALAASVFLLFYQFWGLFATGAQVAILIAAALGCVAVTVWLQGRDSTGYFTKLAALVAFACFVLNIVMLGQIFNITPSDKALVPWAALALLLAYTCDLRLLLAAGILCVIAFAASRTGSWDDLYWIYFWQRPENFFPVAVALFVFPQFVRHDRFAGFAAIYRIFGLVTLFVPMLVLSNWGYGSYLDLESKVIEWLYMVLGFAGTAAAAWLGVRRGWPEVVNAGVTLFMIFLYSKFLDWWWDSMPKYLFFLVVGLTAILFLVVLRRLRGVTHKPAAGDAL